GFPGLERNDRALHICYDLSVGAYFEIRQVSAMEAFRIIEAVLHSRRIEMFACRFEVRGIALAELMDMESVFSRRELFRFQVNMHSIGFLRELRFADLLARGIDDWYKHCTRFTAFNPASRCVAD